MIKTSKQHKGSFSLGLGVITLSAMLLLTGCSAVDVYRADGKSVKGIPFIAKKVVTKQESVWQLNALAVSLIAVGESDGKTNDLGTIIIPTAQYTKFKNDLDRFTKNAVPIGEINRTLQEYIASRSSTNYLQTDWSFVSNRKVVATVFDPNIYYINSTRPLVGSVGFTPELNSDGQLTKVAATAEDKTIPTFLDPFKDALGAAAKAGFGIESGVNYYFVRITKVEPKGIAIVTVTKELAPGSAVGKPIYPPDIFSSEGNGSQFDGLDITVSQPEDKKVADEKPAFKFSGSVTPPK